MDALKFEELISTWRKIIAISERPEPDEYKLLLKITIGGLFLVGGIGFLLHLLLGTVQGGIFG